MAKIYDKNVVSFNPLVFYGSLENEMSWKVKNFTYV